MNLKKYLIALAAIPFSSSISQAANFVVYFKDSSNGVDWSGVVDTKADTLSIHRWSADRNKFYLKPDSSIIFNAVTGDNSKYDVSDSWDGTFTNWGFLSEQAWTAYKWTDGSDDEVAFDIPNATKIGIGVIETYVEESQTGTGPQKGGGGTPIVITPAHFDRTYNNSAMTDDPVNGRNLTPSKFEVTSSAAPEPSSTLMLIMGMTGALIRRKR